MTASTLSPMMTQDNEILTLEAALMCMKSFLRDIIAAIKVNDYGDVEVEPLFKNTVAKSSRKISVYLKDDGEAYGMNIAIYEALMNYSRSERLKFKNLLVSGDFHFEGKNSYSKKMIVITVGNGNNIPDSHIPSKWLPDIPDIIEVGSRKRKVFRGPGIKSYKSARTAVVNSKKLTEKLVSVIDELLVDYNEIKKKSIATASIKTLWRFFNKEEEFQRSKYSINESIINSLREYMSGIMKSGGRFGQIESTIDTLLTAVSVKHINSSIMEEVLGIHRKRIANAKANRKILDDLMIEEDQMASDKSDSESPLDASSCYSTDIDNYHADFGDEISSNDSQSDYITSGSESESINIEPTIIKAVAKKPLKRNIFYDALSPKERKKRIDKLNLAIVRDFCHETCRLDTFASSKIFVRNYDGSHSYHQIHIRSQSLREYYKMFQNSTEYHQWQNENKRECVKQYKVEPFIYPTIKFRSFTNAFCPCCLNQKQRDCANHVQVNLNNALKALGNLRRFQSISNSIKSCTCVGHRNENYIRCPTSLTYFKDAIMCPRTKYPDLSEQGNFLMTIENMEIKNIEAEKEKENYKTQSENVNRNVKREGAARQTDKIHLVNWGPLFTCHSKECAYQQCNNCGVRKFFSDANLCSAERNIDAQVIVRKYENVLGRSRGMQLEIVETKMNGDELIEHLINCAIIAMPHEWNVTWNAHARTVCVNTSLPGALHLMTDFSAVLDHDVQDKLNTAIPCRSNQCIFLATHSPRHIRLENDVIKRIQEYEVWHFWSGQGGVLEANSYYHSVCTRHIIKEYSSLDLKRVNIFTDGCAEQYKSRRNAYFVAALAEETNMTVTHNFAPTASFKTMVDGQGNVTKALYRRLERSEVEGTRCPTTYDLFKLFTSEYKMIPDVVEDLLKNPMTITGRRHRFLVDIADATPEMKHRALHQKDVIITNYIEERWDAPPIKNIKSIYSLIASCENGKINFRSRPHACFCNRCIEGDFEACLHGEISGPLRDEIFLKLPFKEKATKKDCLTEELRRLQFFKGPIPLNSLTPMIVAIPRKKKDVSDESFVLGIITKKVKELSKDIQCEHVIDSLVNKNTVKKGTYCMTVKLLSCKNVVENEYYIPVKTTEIKVPIVNLYIPVEGTELKRENYILCQMQTVQQTSGQMLKTYIIDCNSIDDIRLAMS